MIALEWHLKFLHLSSLMAIFLSENDKIVSNLLEAEAIICSLSCSKLPIKSFPLVALSLS